MTEYFSTIPQKERLNVEFVCMDMWKPYKQIVNQFLPNATIVIDSFHVLQTIKACIKNLEMGAMRQKNGTIVIKFTNCVD